MKANSEKTKQSKKATRRVLAGVLCGASVLSLVLSLVMPPISQAIANDAQTEETVTEDSSSESTDVDNTNNGDTENQNSDETEGDETSGGAVATGLSPDDTEAKSAEQPAEDDTNGEDAIAPAAENESDYEIRNGAELSSKLLNNKRRDGAGAATFKLMADIDYDDEIRLEQSSDNLINITLNLNGHKIKHDDSNGKPLFDIAKGATLTVVDDVDSGHIQEDVDDGQQLQDKDEHLTPENYGKTAKMTYDKNGIPTGLIYYVTESTASGVGTTEKIYEHKATIQGAIVGVTKNSTMKLINVYQGGTFNLQGGTLTQKEDCNVGSLIYAENGSTVNMSGGYVCGASTGTSGTGAGIMVNTNGNVSTLSLIGGVIAANYAPKGAGVYSNGSNVSISKDAVISGNATFNGESDQPGYGGGIMAVGGSVTVSGGYITNNRMAKFCGNDGWGCHGGGGLAANNGAHVSIFGGQITGNYSEEAGGGVYVTDVGRNDKPRTGMAWLHITGGIIASNVSYQSEGAGIRVGQMVDAMIGDATSSKVYITNNHCMSRFDWGGGGIFVQGNSDAGKEKTAGRLFVYNSYISSNTAGGYGGGVAVCPTGKTLVTNTNGTAIFGNSSAGSEQNAIDYKPADGKYNNGTPHLSAGGAEGFDKTEDQDAYNSKVFRENGHADFFLVAKAGHKEPLAAIIGKMLGGEDAKYRGSKERSDNKEPSDNDELYEAITIPANGGVKIYRSVGLTSDVKVGSDEANKARDAATTFITGNYSWDHGGGIMSNGDLYLGQPADTYVYPSLKLKATKALSGRALKEGEFSFAVYRKDSDSATAPYWNNKTFNNGDCTFVGSAKNSADGNITFDLGEQFLASGTGEITYYLVEDAGKDPDVDYDHAVYEIKVTVEDHTTMLMSVPTQNDPNATKDLKVHNYTIKSVNVKNLGASTALSSTVPADADGYYSIANSDGSKTFNNTYTLYTSDGSWTPKATKVVKGGEMMEFTLEIADNEKFEDAKTVKTTADGTNNPQTLSFVDKITYKLNDLNKGEDPTGRGASKTFTYYVREQLPTTPFTNYKYDKSVYKITVTATDQSDKTIKCDVNYTKIVNADGKDIPEKKQNPVTYVPAKDEATGKEQSVPVFTNTYSTSLPLSGMSGVTLTYLAGAAVLCAAAAWMHIRRKANAKGGKRRE